MIQSKKIGWVSVLFVLMLSLHPGIVAALDSTTLSFPGNGYVGVSKHKALIGSDLEWMIESLTGQSFNHTWVTATVGEDQGVIHSEGATDKVNFLKWSEFLDTCVEGSIQLFKPDKKAIGEKELEESGIDLSTLPPIFRKLLTRQLGDLMINIWIQGMLAYSGRPYDWYFMPDDDEIYCSELLAHGWDLSSSFQLFEPKPASELAGWETFGEFSGISENTLIYDLADIPTNSYFEKIYP